MRKDFDLMFASLGNGITVFDRNREENGDYKIVAHINSSRQITYRMSLPDKVKDKIRDYAKNEDPSISQSQSEKVFRK